MTVHFLPSARATRIPRSAIGLADPHNYTFGEICQQLGLLDRGMQYRIAYVRGQVESFGFPDPHPHLVQNSSTWLLGAKAVRPGAKWPRNTVDAWFDGHLPPSARQAAATAETAEIDSLIATRLAGNVA